MAELLPHAFGVEDLDGHRGDAGAGGAGAAGRLAWARHRLRAPGHVRGQQVWTAYWERSAGDDAGAETGVLEEAPSWDDPAEAITWGMARTPRVVVVDATGTIFWAGEGEPPARFRCAGLIVVAVRSRGEPCPAPGGQA